jgi:hypothetical protein
MPKRIHIRVKSNKVDAFESGSPNGGGHVFATTGERITWQHQQPGLNQAFIATFFDITNNQSGYPFTPTDPTNQVRIPPGATLDRDLDPNASEYWKYTVSVEPPTDICPHDPMIIIRRRAGLSLAPVVIAAIGGAVVGALLAYALLTR